MKEHREIKNIIAMETLDRTKNIGWLIELIDKYSEKMYISNLTVDKINLIPSVKCILLLNMLYLLTSETPDWKIIMLATEKENYQIKPNQVYPRIKKKLLCRIQRTYVCLCRDGCRSRNKANHFDWKWKYSNKYKKYSM